MYNINNLHLAFGLTTLSHVHFNIHVNAVIYFLMWQKNYMSCSCQLMLWNPSHKATEKTLREPIFAALIAEAMEKQSNVTAK